MYTSAEIRQMFLDFFVTKDHMIEKGHSLIPYDDPTLLWINSGVAALKPYFDGRIKPENRRIVNAQKAIRSNDIENVGKTSRHHTFFEMLGNFSIGDYFKKEAILYAWEFLTSEKWMNLDADKLYVSIHTHDDEAFKIWTETIGIPETKILQTEDNFWQIGDGPCGPNTEIHYDRGEGFDPDKLGEKLFFEELENDRYVEVWNIVFSQYEGIEGQPRESYRELPQKNIDTGMGFERLVCIVQGGETNYDTDLFLPIIHTLEAKTKLPYHEHKEAYRVIADHIRTIVFALGDGALFSNEGRGYVLRRILRRAVRYGLSLNLNEPFMFDLVPIVANVMKDYYPELLEKVKRLQPLIEAEEARFFQTLSDGEKMLQQLLVTHKQTIPGEAVFKMYDTFGFPYELTKEIALEKGILIDEEGFQAAMSRQKEMSRASRKEAESFALQQEELMNFETPSTFIGYDTLKGDGQVLALFTEGQAVSSLVEGQEGYAVFDQTPFYAESGGQVGDRGQASNDQVVVAILDTQKAPHQQPLHHVKVRKGLLEVGSIVNLQVEGLRRELIKRNHSSLHLLQAALLQVLGDHVQQAGSYVSEDIGRFDFTHFEKVSNEQLKQIEQLVNQWIFENLAVDVQWMSHDEATKTGAIALFDEKYGDRVRVVKMGDVSMELCGGTHVDQTAELGLFSVISEESVGSGIRRIVSKTSKGAYLETVKFHENMQKLAVEVGAVSLAKFDEKVKQLLHISTTQKQEIQQLQAQINASATTTLLEKIEQIAGFELLIFDQKSDPKAGKDLVDLLKNQMNKPIIFAIFEHEKRLTLVASVSDEAVKAGINAGQLIRQAAQIADGKGGGRKEFAQAGAKDITKVEEIKQFVKDLMTKHFN